MWLSILSCFVGSATLFVALLVSALCIFNGNDPPQGTFTVALLALLLASVGEIGMALRRG